MATKCLKCGSLISGFPCVICKEVMCNSCGMKFVKEKMINENCISCDEKIKHTKGTEKSFVVPKYYGVEIKVKDEEMMIKIIKQGKKKELCDFELKKNGKI